MLSSPGRPAVHCNSGEEGPSNRCELEEGASEEGWSGKQAERARPYFGPLPKKKGSEPDLPNLCIRSRVSAISDVLWCLWWARPLEPN